MRTAAGTGVLGMSLAWALTACVGQLQFDPLQGGGLGGSQAPSGGLGGSPGSTPSGAGGTPVVSDAGTVDVPPQASCPTGFDVLAMFKDRCGGCHGAAAPTKNLDLVTAGLGARTVGVVSTCNKKPLVSSTLAGALASGHLLDKLAGPVTGCGVQMPAGGTPLSAAEMACVQEWALAAIQTANGGSY